MKKIKFNKVVVSRIIISIFVCLFLVKIVLSTPNSINIQGKLTNPSGAIQTGTFNITFRIYDDFTGGNKLYETNVTATTDSRGVYDIILKNVDLDFEKQLYLVVKVNDDSEMEPRVNLTSVPYTFRANISEDLVSNKTYNVAGLNVTGNLSIGTNVQDIVTITSSNLNLTSSGNLILIGNLSLADKITFGLGQIIDSLVSGWLKISGSVNVTKSLIVEGGVNITGDFGVNKELNITAATGGLVTAGSINASGTIQGSTLTDGTTIITSGVVNANQIEVGGGFSAGGLSLQQDGTILTQGDVLFSGNITVINVTYLSVNGSIIPGLDNTFNIGNTSFRWKNANFSGTLEAGTLSDGIATITSGIITGASMSADQITAGTLNIGVNSFTVNGIEVVGSDGIVNEAAVESTITRDAELDNGTVIRTANLRTALSNNTDANFVNVTVVSLLMDYHNITSIPTCASNERLTFDGNDLSCSVVSASSATSFNRENVTDYLGGTGANDSIVRASNVTYVTSQSVGGEVSGIIGNIVLDNDALDDQYEGLTNAFNLGNLTNYFGDSGFNASLLRVGNISNILLNAFKNVNFTMRYDLRIDRYGKTNYSEEYAATGFKIENLTSDLLGKAVNFSYVNVSQDLIILGNVGIGTTIPTEKLVVIGNVSINDSDNVGHILIDSTNNAILFNGENGSLYQPVYGTDDDLILYLPLSEGIGTTAYDRSPYGNDGAITAGTGGWTTGKYGNAYDFDGSATFINVGQDIYSQSTFSNGGTLEAWVNPTSTLTNRDHVVSIEGRFIIGESSLSSNKWSTAIYDGDTQTVESLSDIELNKWVHLVATWDSSTLRFYVDGVLQGSVAQGTPLIDPVNRYVSVGAYYDGTLDLTIPAVIDEVRIYKRALSPEEVRTHYLRGSKYNSLGTITADRFRVVNTSGSKIFEINQTNLILGSSSEPINLTMYSPDGTAFNCGPANDGTFTCS
jgi:hypothetical protein